MKTGTRGFALADLLVALAMIGVLAGLLLPVLQNSREAARRNACSDNLRLLAIGLNEYHDVNDVFPSALLIGQNINVNLQREPAPGGYLPNGDPAGGEWWSWSYRIAPYIGAQQFFDQIDPVEDFPWFTYFGPDHPSAGMAIIGHRHKTFFCRSDPRHPIGNYVDPNNNNNQSAITSYLAVNGRNQFAESGGQDGMIYVNSSVSIDEVTDGTSNTVIIGERPPSANLLWGWQWAGAGGSPGGVFFGTTDNVLGVHEIFAGPINDPGQGNSDFFRPGEIADPSNVHRYHFWSVHKGGGNWAFVDGSTRFLTYDIDSQSEPDTPPTILERFATRAGDDNPNELQSSAKITSD